MSPLTASACVLAASLGWSPAWLPAARAPALIALLVALALDVVAWAAFRIDKALARAGRRRVSERALLILTLLGGLGAVTGMYAHRQRHKTQKARFVATAALAALARLAVLGYAVLRARRG